MSEGRGWACVNWKAPKKCKGVSRLFSTIVGARDVGRIESQLEGVNKGWAQLEVSVFARGPSYRESAKKSKERQEKTLGACFSTVSVL